MQFIIEDSMIQQVSHYIGLGEVSDYYDSAEYIQIKCFIEQAYARLYQATKVNWTEVYNPMVTDVINGLCYLSYYAMRDDSKNTAFLEQYVQSRIFDLQMTEESVKARSESGGQE